MSIPANGIRLLLASILVALSAGCAEEWGPTQKVLVDVDGRILLGGTPVSGGWVEFIPIDGAVGDIRSARLAKDGTFHATKVARGRNVLRVVYPPPRLGVDRVFTQFYSPVRPVIDAGTVLNLDLRREALRARAR